MSWRTYVFGAEVLSTGRVITVFIAFMIVGLMLYGVWIDFESEPWVARQAVWYAGVLASLTACWLTWVNLTGRNPGVNASPLVIVLMTPVVALILTFIFWFCLSEGVPGAYTRLRGEPVVKVAVFETQELRSGKGCHFRASTHLDDHFGAFTLCTSEDYYRAHPGRRVEWALSGYRTDYGLYVVDFRHLRDLGRRRGHD